MFEFITKKLSFKKKNSTSNSNKNRNNKLRTNKNRTNKNRTNKNRNNRNNKSKNLNQKLTPDFCPQINIDVSQEGGNILHNDKICSSKKLLTTSHLFKMLNMDIDQNNKKVYLVKEHVNKGIGLDSITFFGITQAEFNDKKNQYKKMNK